MWLLNKTHSYTAVLLAGMLLLQAVLVSSCGFRLRGSVELPESLANIQVEGVATYSDLGVNLRNSLQRSGSQVVNKAAVGDSILSITRNHYERRVLSVDSLGRPNEYEIKYLLGFAVTDTGGKPLLAEQQITMLRDYRFDANNVLAKGDEEERIKQEMMRNAVTQMVRRISIGMANRTHRQEPVASQPGTTVDTQVDTRSGSGEATP